MEITSSLFVTAPTAHAAAVSPLPPTPVLPYVGSLRLVGTVFASDASTFDGLMVVLADKTRRQGATAWRVNTVNNGNRLHGLAIIYQ